MNLPTFLNRSSKVHLSCFKHFEVLWRSGCTSTTSSHRRDKAISNLEFRTHLYLRLWSVEEWNRAAMNFGVFQWRIVSGCWHQPSPASSPFASRMALILAWRLVVTTQIIAIGQLGNSANVTTGQSMIWIFLLRANASYQSNRSLKIHTSQNKTSCLQVPDPGGIGDAIVEQGIEHIL